MMCAHAQAPRSPQKAAIDWLASALRDKDRANGVLSALRATRDKDLVPVFVAMSRGADKRRRVFATAALNDLGGDDAVEALKQRLTVDPAMSVRATALVGLLDHEAADADLLTRAVGIADENIQCIAARALSIRVRDDPDGAAGRALAKRTLTKLVGSKDAATAALARMGLLAIGQTEQFEPLKQLVTAKDTQVSVLRLLLQQISEEKIAPAAPLARAVIAAGARPEYQRPLHVRVLACRALAAASPKATHPLYEALRYSPNMIFRVSVLAILAERKDAGRYLQAIAKSKIAVGALARFELARKSPGPSASASVREALALGHPVVVNYVLNRALDDADKIGDKADFYTTPLAEYIRSVPPDVVKMGPQHVLAAQAATWLLDLGTPAATAAMQKILSGRYSAVTRAAAAGLLRSKNKKVCALARGLIKSPYPELSSDAALALGHFADPAAEGYFRRIIMRETGHRTEELALASWYLLKIHKQTKTAAAELARQIK